MMELELFDDETLPHANTTTTTTTDTSAASVRERDDSCRRRRLELPADESGLT